MARRRGVASGRGFRAPQEQTRTSSEQKSSSQRTNDRQHDKARFRSFGSNLINPLRVSVWLAVSSQQRKSGLRTSRLRARFDDQEAHRDHKFLLIRVGGFQHDFAVLAFVR